MIRFKSALVLFLSVSITGYGQENLRFADSIRKAKGIPELGYAVVSDTSIVDMAILGNHSVNLKDTATIEDRFHIGSLTKAMTAFIIAKYVEKGQLRWTTKFFDLFPDWKKNANSAYHTITLQDLLSHRAGIQPFQGNNDPKIPDIKGTKQQKRQAFGKFVLTLDPVKADTVNKYVYSNAGYTLATLMLESVSGKSWEQLVTNTFNRDLRIGVKFSWPENQKGKDTWGHYSENNKLIPVPSDTNYQLDFTEPAGDLNISLKDYVKFLQLHIRGLEGQDNYLKSKTYTFLHKGIENYSIGWFNSYENGNNFSTHSGTAGTYYSLVAIDRTRYIGYIIFTNSFSEETVEGVRLLMRRLKAEYAK